MDIEPNTICRKSADQNEPNGNPKSKGKLLVILRGIMIKYTNGSKIVKKTKTRMQAFCENLPRSNYPMYGWLQNFRMRI